MQSEACSHIGLNANQFCRCCHAGGTQEYKQSDEGFVTLLEVSLSSTAKLLPFNQAVHLLCSLAYHGP